MRTRIIRIFSTIIIILALLDAYIFWNLQRNLFPNDSLTSYIYLIINAGFFIYIVYRIVWFVRTYYSGGDREVFNRIFSFTGILLFFYLPKILMLPFALVSDLFQLIRVAGLSGSYLNVLSGVFWISGFILASLALVLIPWGVFVGRFRFVIRKRTVFSPGLPEGLDGLRIVHFSDLHTGSLSGQQDKFSRIIQSINNLNADLILFTGDIVNNFAEEMKGWEGLLDGLKSSSGKFAVLGNHDYGEYYDWASEKEWRENMDRLTENYRDTGFQLLKNESVAIKKNGSQLKLIGVENWGLPPFKQYGDLSLAMKGSENGEFKILMSHDPSHWDEEVKVKTDVDLTLSGHTHGMQFGIFTSRFRWSPIKLKYPKWGGMYREGKQYLHVSTGLGYIGFPVRIGVPPEIVLIEIKKGNPN